MSATAHAIKFASAREALLDLLADGHWHEWRELKSLCVRYGARIFEARAIGWDIESQEMTVGKCYRLNGYFPSEPKPSRCRLMLDQQDVEQLADSLLVTPAVRLAARKALKAHKPVRQPARKAP